MRSPYFESHKHNYTISIGCPSETKNTVTSLMYKKKDTSVQRHHYGCASRRYDAGG